MKQFILYPVDLALFGAGENVNTTTGYVDANTGNVTSFNDTNSLSEEMKTYYSDYLIDNAEPELVHDQFAQKHNIPKNGGKTIQFRKYAPLSGGISDRTLKEGVTPKGQTLSMSIVEATVGQYGGFVELSDMLLLSAIDNNLVQATRLLASQAGKILDAITREELAGGTNVMFCGGKTERAELDGETCYIKVNDVKKAVRALKRENAPKIDGGYVAIIHPDIEHDLTNDPEWKYPHQYADPSAIFEGEIGKVAGVRFVATSEAKIWPKGSTYQDGDDTKTLAADVYATFVLGADAYGTTEITGGGLEHIVKQLGSAGSADPLNQRATVGWKASKVTVRLVEEYMVRIESTASFTEE